VDETELLQGSNAIKASFGSHVKFRPASLYDQYY